MPQLISTPRASLHERRLFAEIRKHHPGFGYRVVLDENMNKFASTWPDALSTTEPLRDLGYSPTVDLAGMVGRVLAAHEDRNSKTAQVHLPPNSPFKVPSAPPTHFPLCHVAPSQPFRDVPHGRPSRPLTRKATAG